MIREDWSEICAFSYFIRFYMSVFKYPHISLSTNLYLAIELGF